jgi:hypothetical protein
MRDAVEHLRRLDPLAAFPIRVPKPELMTTVLVGLVAVLLAIAPNPWLLRQRAANPAASVAREQAQRVDRLADSLHPEQSQEIQQLRDVVRKGARTIDARSNEPESALNALEDLEQQIRDMSAGDDQLSAALSAIASALAADPNTQQLADAINTGDLRQVAQAAKDLAQRSEQLDGNEKAQVARVLRDAANRASRASPGAAGDLADAAAALSGGQAGADAADDPNNPDANSQDGQNGQQGGAQASSGAQNGRSAQDALNSLSSSAAAAAERQRAASQLEGSRNALERALGRTQSRSASGASSSSSSGRSSRSGQSGQNGDQTGDGSGQGQASDQSGSGDQGSGGAQGGDGSTGGEDGQGGGYSTGGTPQNRTGQASQMDAVTTPQQDTDGSAQPDYSMDNPYLGDASDGSSQVGDQSVNPSFQRGKATQGNDQGTIPLGLRDLVKDYFSSLGQK